MRRSAALFALAALSCTLVSAAHHDDLLPDEVQEDWELVIGTTDVEGVGPQMTTTMSPVGDNSQTFVSFNLNYRDDPFQPGGMEVAAWSGRTLLTKDSDKTAQCETDGETITWTQTLSISDGSIDYGVDHGRSTTWKKFGQGNNLNLSFDSNVANLLAYDPDVSIANSGAGWESDHVTSMRIVQVRYYANGQLIKTDTTVRDAVLPP